MSKVLDPCSGSRMFYFDKQDPRVTFGDIRTLPPTELCDGRLLEVRPDIEMDFRALPFPDDTFNVVVFDPPHLLKIGMKAYLSLKYGRLEKEWREDLKQGFKECFRVLKPSGVLIFKWNEVQIRTKDVLALTPYKPLVGHISGKRSNTHWITFLKDE